MRKIALFVSVFAAILMCGTAYAANGDIAGEIYTTDILTQIDGKDIPSYAINGETLIALEDLEAYGFNVKYDDSIRTVFVNQTGTCPEDFNPSVPRGKVGGIAGYYYESDIKAYVNGSYVSAYSLNGKMAAKVEELGDAGENSTYGISQYLMTYNWDNDKRLLSLYTEKDKLPSVEKIKDDYKNSDSFGWFFSREIPTESGCVLVGGNGGTTHGTYMNYKFLRYSDKLYMRIDEVLRAYGFYDYWGHTEADNIRTDRDNLVFDGVKFDGRNGTYSLNLLTFEMSVVGEEKFDPNLRSVPEEISSPEGKSIKTSGVNVEIDKKPVQAYSGQNLYRDGDSITFIDADVLLHFGFTKSENDGIVIYNKTGKTDTAWNDAVRPSGEDFGTVVFDDKSVYINGRNVGSYIVGGKRLINADHLWDVSVYQSSAEYVLHGKYGLSDYLISGKYDSETNTLSLDTSGYTDVYFDTLKEAVKLRNFNLPSIYTPDDVKVTVIADTDNLFIVSHSFKEEFGADCYMVVTEDGKYGKAYHINEFFALYGVSQAESFSYADNHITAKTGNGSEYSLDLDTFIVTGV